MDLSLQGKTALVLGASQGIGRAVAVTLAEQGARVVAVARNEDSLAALCRELPGSGHQFLAQDVRDRTALFSRVETVAARTPIEILVCNTGGPKGGPINEATEAAFVHAFEDHVLVNSGLVQRVLPGMKARSFGRIINIISTSVKIPIVGLGVSNTIRAAVASWAKTLSYEVAPFGVTVNSVLPGYTETARLKSLLQAAAVRDGVGEESVAAEWRRTIPMRRFADASEVAAAVGFLASPAASYITGVALPVDGGRTGTL